jgi:hypothetical protein
MLGKKRAIQITPDVIDQYVKTRLATGRELQNGTVRHPTQANHHPPGVERHFRHPQLGRGAAI